MADAALALRHHLQRMDETLGSSSPDYPGKTLTTGQLAYAATLVVGEVIDVERLLLRGRARGARRLAHARTQAMALVHLVCGRSQEDVARAFDRNRTTASNHMEMMEALNDVAEHEEFWDALCLRFVKYVELMATPAPRDPWRRALAGMERALDDGDLEGDAVDQVKYVLGVFAMERAGVDG